MPKESAAVIKFGGSASTNEHGANPDYFLPTLASIQKELTQLYSRVVFVIGGGPRVRAAQQLVESPEEKDRVGIQILREHASQLGSFATLSGLDASPLIARNEEEAQQIIAKDEHFSVVFGGLKKGQSTDAVAITAAELLAQHYDSVRIAILSNVWQVFTADPKKDPSAKPLSETDLQALLRLGVLFDDPSRFIPGMNVVLDPVAVSKLTKMSTENFPTLWFGHADDKPNLKNFLAGKPLNNGTKITR